MDTSILQCINIRTDFFKNYYSVPPQLEAEVNAFIQDMYALGKVSADSVDFEARFSREGFQERFNGILVRCTPIAHKMSKEEKSCSRSVAKEMLREDSRNIIKDAAAEAIDYVKVAAEEEMIAKRREAMIEDGVFDDYTRASNAVDMARDGTSLLKKLFRKNK